MAVVTQYASKYFRDSNNVSEQVLPLCQPGEIKVFEDYVSIASGAQLAANDLIKLARLAAGHRPVRLEYFINADIESNSGLVMDVGTSNDQDLLASGVSPTAAATPVGYVAPTTVPLIRSMNDVAAPTSPYDVQFTVTTGATGSAAANATIIYFRLFYTCPATAYDGTNSPAAVAGTQ